MPAIPTAKPLNRIAVDGTRFRQTWLDFLKHPASARIRDEMTTSFGICLFLWFLLFFVALFQIVTIRWAIDGFKGLWCLITLEPFQAMNDNPVKKPENYAPIVAHGVIIGPDRIHGLVLSSLREPSEISQDQIARIATEFGSLYANGSNDPSDAKVLALLREDGYRPDRRRKLPDDHPAAALNLVLLDAELDLKETRQTPFGTMITAMVVKKGASGPTAQLPWAVAESAVQMR